MPAAPPHPWVDVHAYPIVIVAFPEVASASDVRAMTIALRQFSQSLKEPFALLNDLSAVRSTDPEARAVYIDFVKDMRATTGHLVRATAVIARSPFQRAMLNLHSLLVGKTPYPVRAFASRSEALPWLWARLGAST